MRDDLKENIKVSAQRFVPLVLSFVFILLNYIPTNFSFPNIIRPEIGLICVFYWVLHRPDLFNVVVVFLLGFVEDAISAVPLGAHIISYLVAYLIVSNTSSFFNNKPYNVVWSAFSFIFVVAEFVKWLIVSIYYAEFLAPGNLFFTILFTIACYPVVSFFNDIARKYLMNDEG